MRMPEVELMAIQQRYEIAEATHSGLACRSICDLARGLGFSETELGKLARLVTECAAHLLTSEAHGELLVRPLAETKAPGALHYGVEVLSIDSGPGVADIQAYLSQLKRWSDELDVWTAPGHGSVLRFVSWNRPTRTEETRVTDARVLYGVVNLPLRGEFVSGDAWSCYADEDNFTVLVADGLGHGPMANRAATEAVKILEDCGGAPLESILDRAHHALRSTVGAAVGVARFPICVQEESQVKFAGIGNLAASVWAETSHKHLASHDGVIGHAYRRVQQFEVPCAKGALIVLHSDGLMSRWDLSRYPVLAVRHPALVAAVLYRDYARGHDDVTVFVARANHVR
ncbi:SpoIIE family protein phosphatase [Caballeronia sp. INDeC2]|uniref:SpoIIE family protein phosphatase n=1 Tax=Caballeronia sp. INDeC2 TaxID=2921747 RepID=UPI0020285D72|nr:SpoIIE family protein phosphatase [Caballeronia sp. INDeC2]